MTIFPATGVTRLQASPDDPGATSYHVPGSSSLFTGHFDRSPIVPGVAHLALALDACARRDGRRLTLVGLRDVRFSQPMGPDVDVTVHLADTATAGEVRFELRSSARTISSGVMRLAAESHVDA